MAPLVSSIEIARPQDEVFSYVTDPSRFREWQAGVVGGSIEPGKAPSVGAKCVTTRRIGGGERHVTSEITKIDPPSRWAVHGIDGPIRATVDVTVEPHNAGTGHVSRSRWSSKATASASCSFHGRPSAGPQRNARKRRTAKGTPRSRAKPSSDVRERARRPLIA